MTAVAVTRKLRHVCGCFLLLAIHASVFAGDSSHALTTTYLPQLIAAQGSFNTDPLAVVDTLSYRKHVTGNDGIVPLSVLPSTPTGQSYFTPLPSACPSLPPPAPPPPCQLTIPFPVPNSVNAQNPQPMNIEAPADNNAGFAIVNSTGSRYLQFVLLTKGTADSMNNPHAELTAQTWYRISNDGGHTFGDLKQIIIPNGTVVDPFNPLPGVKVGVNGYEFPGDSLVVASNGEQDVLIPLEIVPLGADGHPVTQEFNVTSYMEVHILRGHWRSDNSDLDWELGQAAQVSIAQSSRGLDETAIAELAPNGHCVIVSRGSNQNASNPGRYWLFESQDGCRHWVGPGVPLAWDDGSDFNAPAAAPLLYKNSNNRIIFMGANLDANQIAQGNIPRTRVVAAELDIRQLKLLKRSAVIVDEKDIFDTDGVDLIYGNRYYPRATGSIFYYTTRVDSSYCTGDCLTANLLSDNPNFPLNWHLLNPIPTKRPDFKISVDPAVPNHIVWPARPNAARFLIYARNASKQNFWQLNNSDSTSAEPSGSATGYVLHDLPTNTATEVTVYVVHPDGSISSSNQIKTTVH